PPPVNSREKPGLGPEVAPKKGAALGERRGLSPPDLPPGQARRLAAEGPLFAVIAAPPIGALLAMLAMMFPTVFGGWKRWLALLTVLATNSTLYGLQYWFATSLVESWWGTPAALWTVMTLVVVLGSAWAWQRHLARVQAGEAPP